jgi:GDP-D-mannose dehydratase
VEEIISVLQQETSDDFVLASGEMHSVREFVEKSFAIAGITIQWEGYEVNEVGLNAQTGQVVVRIDRESRSIVENILLKQCETDAFGTWYYVNCSKVLPPS